MWDKSRSLTGVFTPDGHGVWRVLPAMDLQRRPEGDVYLHSSQVLVLGHDGFRVWGLKSSLFGESIFHLELDADGLPCVQPI
jgi:hypothetical protein